MKMQAFLPSFCRQNAMRASLKNSAGSSLQIAQVRTNLANPRCHQTDADRVSHGTLTVRPYQIDLVVVVVVRCATAPAARSALALWHRGWFGGSLVHTAQCAVANRSGRAAKCARISGFMRP